jgi:alpha-ketoglutarate-dependent 2,4-dichlorophenoxyacetate dioxygenase
MTATVSAAARALAFRPLAGTFAAEITDLDLREPLRANQVEAIQRELDRYAVLVFRDQRMSDEQQVAFSRHFGSLQVDRGGAGGIGPPRAKGLPQEIVHASNVAVDGKTRHPEDSNRMAILQARLWHTDRPFMPVPVKYSLLATHSVPTSGGETQFADMRASYMTLPDHRRELIEPLIVEHSTFRMRALAGYTDFSDEERAAYPPQQRPLVQTNPRSGRKALYLSAHAARIVGWSVPESLALLYELTDHATRPEFVYTHKWVAGDMVMWDDFATMHRSRPHYPEDEPRDMRRTSIE